MNGEIELSLGGKLRKLRFTMWAIEENQRLISDQQTALFQSTTANTTSLVYAGLRNSYRIESKKEDFTPDDVRNWVYDLFDTEDGHLQVLSIVECFQSCNAYKNLVKANEDAAKKNSNGTTSTALPLVN